jgi:hypothetical protein
MGAALLKQPAPGNPRPLRPPTMSTTKRIARRTVIVSSSPDGYDAPIRLSLGEPTHGSVSGRLGRDMEVGTGVFARALWIGRKHVVLLTYSQWDAGDGSCTGDTYRLCDVDDARMIGRVFGDDAQEAMLDTLRVPVRTIDGTVAA